MNKNILCFFFFLFITQNVRTGKRERESKVGELALRGADGTDLLRNLFTFPPFGSKSSWLCNILDAYANSSGHISNLLLILCPWTRFLLTCHPYNFRCISAGATCVLFTLDTRCISCHFFPVSDFLLASHPRNLRGACQNGSSSEYPTHILFKMTDEELAFRFLFSFTYWWTKCCNCGLDGFKTIRSLC